MRKLLLSIALLAIASTAQAASYNSKVFALYSASSAAVKSSEAINVKGYSTKTVYFSGATLGSNATTTTFKNMSGTALVQCAPTSSGPWSTCIANDYGQTAVSRTTNGSFTWRDGFHYIRLYWTAGTLGTKLKAYFNFVE